MFVDIVEDMTKKKYHPQIELPASTIYISLAQPRPRVYYFLSAAGSRNLTVTKLQPIFSEKPHVLLEVLKRHT